jgi:alkylation response protein AidB-like acyl-CoA dehydrogenase
VLSGFGRFAAEVLAPTDRIGDTEGVRFDPSAGDVAVPPRLREAYRRWVADGWSGLAVPTENGGGGFPAAVGAAAEEMFASANMALSLNPMLTQGAVHLLSRWGSDSQRATYLAKLVSGEWTGTMNLTEPNAGSDVGAIRTRAVPIGGRRWAIRPDPRLPRRHEGHLALRRPPPLGLRRRHGGEAQRSALRGTRAQARYSREPYLCARLRRRDR